MNKLSSKLSGLLISFILMTVMSSHVLAGGLYELNFYTEAKFSDSTNIDNPYWPQIPGSVLTYFAETEDGCEWNRVTVTPGFKEVNGVWSIVVMDEEWFDESDEDADYDCTDRRDDYPTDFPYGTLTEFTFDWYAQDDLKNIWYMGEDTFSYDWEDDECEVVVEDACKDGSFEAGVGDAEAGIVMMGEPSKGDFYQQEYDPDNAEDMGKVLNFVQLDDVECLKTKEWTPLERGAIEHKYYCPDENLGFSVLYFIEEVSGGPKIGVDLIDATIPD